MSSQRTALITGSTTGIGLATARALASRGFMIMLNGLGDADEIEEIRASLGRAHGVEVRFHGADLARRDEVVSLFEETAQSLGGPEIIVNNAVTRFYAEIPDLDPRDWDRAIAVNLTAPFDLCRLALPVMRATGWGRIVNMSSVMGLAGRSGRAEYVTTKTGLIGLTRAIAAETLRDPHITCNAICPGSVLTPFIRERISRMAAERSLTWDEMSVAYRKELGQQGDFIAPERIAALVAFLCGDDAVDITGIEIPVDAGLSGTWMEPPP
jgi:3-hydroxybutyrate dehydrogenase